MLHPLSSVTYTRHQWQWQHDQDCFMIMMDRNHDNPHPLSHKIFELELEWVSGDPHAMITWLLTLNAPLGLHLKQTHKASFGYKCALRPAPYITATTPHILIRLLCTVAHLESTV